MLNKDKEAGKKTVKNLNFVKDNNLTKKNESETSVRLKFPSVNNNAKNKQVKQSRSHSSNKWTTNMPPTIGYNTNVNSSDLPEYNEKEFVIYSVFREKILDKIVREHLKDSLHQTIDAYKKKNEMQSKKIKIQEQQKDRLITNSQNINFDIGETQPELQANVRIKKLHLI